MMNLGSRVSTPRVDLLSPCCLLCLLTLIGEVGPEELPRVNTQDVGDLIGEDEIVRGRREEWIFYHVVVSPSLLHNEIEELGNGLGLVSIDSRLQRLPTLHVPFGLHHEFAGMELSCGSDEVICYVKKENTHQQIWPR